MGYFRARLVQDTSQDACSQRLCCSSLQDFNRSLARPIEEELLSILEQRCPEVNHRRKSGNRVNVGRRVAGKVGTGQGTHGPAFSSAEHHLHFAQATLADLLGVCERDGGREGGREGAREGALDCWSRLRSAGFKRRLGQSKRSQ